MSTVKEVNEELSELRGDFAGFRGRVETELGLFRSIAKGIADKLVALIVAIVIGLLSAIGGAFVIGWQFSALNSEVKAQASGSTRSRAVWTGWPSNSTSSSARRPRSRGRSDHGHQRATPRDHGQRPFRPFLVVTAGGDEFQVRDPGNASCSVKGDEMVVYDDRGMHVLDMRDADIRRAGPEAAAKTSDEGDPIHATMTPEERRQIDQFQAWCKANGYTSRIPSTSRPHSRRSRARSWPYSARSTRSSTGRPGLSALRGAGPPTSDRPASRRMRTGR